MEKSFGFEFHFQSVSNQISRDKEKIRDNSLKIANIGVVNSEISKNIKNDKY
jgi:hypothetical protein